MKKKPMNFINGEHKGVRKREQMVHNVLVALLWALVLLPLLLCIVLFARVGQLEKELHQIKEMNAQTNSGSFRQELEEMALAEKEKSSEQEKNNDTSKTDNQTQTEVGVSPSASAVETEKRVYLTFDDGPSDHTEDILELLEAENMTATFFCIGKTDEHSVAMYKRILEGGHTLAMHSYSHDYSGIYANLEAFKADFHKIQDYMEEVTGQKPIYYRFPGGSSNAVSKVSMKECIRFLDSEGVAYFDWNALNGDAEGKTYTVEEMLQRTMSGIKLYDSPVVLMHDTNAKQKTLEMLPTLIKKLKKMNAAVVGIDENTPLVQHIKVSSVVGE